MYKQFRNHAGMTIDHASEQLCIAPRTLAKYESGEIIPSAEMVVAMGEVYGIPQITAYHCKNKCAIGHRYCYYLLNNVDLNPIAILAKFMDEKREMDALLDGLLAIVLNKNGPGDFSSEEMEFFKNALLELCDIEHVIETLKLASWRFVNVGQVIREHNQKCVDQGYFQKEKAPLAQAL